MKSAADNKTADLLPGHDLAGERPPELTAADKARARMDRYKTKHGKAALTVWIDAEVVKAFEALCIAKDRKKNAEIERLIKTRYLSDAARKR
jgi:hypothetical protein